MIRSIQRGRHVRGCEAKRNFERGEWPTPWSDFTEGAVFRDMSCRKNQGFQGPHIWLEFRCNDRRCNTVRLFVYVQDVLVEAQK